MFFIIHKKTTDPSKKKGMKYLIKGSLIVYDLLFIKYSSYDIQRLIKCKYSMNGYASILECYK